MKTIFWLLTVVVAIVPVALHGQTITCKAPDLTTLPKIDSTTVQQPDDTVDLASVVAAVQAAIDCYQANRGAGPDGLLPLTSAAFDFKTTTGKVGGISVNFFIFKIGATHEKDTTNDLTLTYAVKPVTARGRSKPPQELSDALANAMLAAAAAAKKTPSVDGIPLSKVAINIAFGVKNDVSGGLTVAVHLVTLSPSGDYNKSYTQSVTLTFGQ